MDLILWRHAEADGAGPDGQDMLRPLTARGQKQARRMADWLEKRLPGEVRVLSSPALRARQTVQALGCRFDLCEELAPGNGVAQLLGLVHGSDAKPALLLVGHQPVLGEAVALLLGFKSQECSLRKGSIWWLRWQRDPQGKPARTAVVAVMHPDLL